MVYQLLIATSQHFQHPLVGVVDEHRYELPVLFFSTDRKAARIGSYSALLTF
jgi:hypothetical protein